MNVTYIDSMSIICDLEQLQTAVLDQDLNRARTRINRVLD